MRYRTKRLTTARKPKTCLFHRQNIYKTNRSKLLEPQQDQYGLQNKKTRYRLQNLIDSINKIYIKRIDLNKENLHQTDRSKQNLHKTDTKKKDRSTYLPNIGTD